MIGVNEGIPMSITITDPDLLARLSQTSGETELLDPSGRIIGIFQGELFGLPPRDYVPPISDEEIERRRQEHRSGKPLSEIMKRLQGGK
jgi:hypothetical protein